MPKGNITHTNTQYNDNNLEVVLVFAVMRARRR